ncbi:NUDIX domain-containing protein [Calidifontibacter sp. DB0510]|uniref:NUDIX domain-containing protein n=2 Tax=Metallococcus carri TaxID=1656884 RepID=A0A967EHJ9_9MICO|nr:NUDIX domain-containing protein [Metallococcus carri]NOP36102.1 NUDIX domain-containing protein [Calidifontibacter sp. DB2511S]
MAKAGPPHHFTASVFVLDQTREHVLLVLHRKAAMWLQPGGHFEAGDADVAAAAAREATEETGLTGIRLHPQLAGLHHHPLAAAFGRCRSHLDLRFVTVVPQDAPRVSEESLEVAWWPIERMPEPTDPDLLPQLRRARQAH